MIARNVKVGFTWLKKLEEGTVVRPGQLCFSCLRSALTRAFSIFSTSAVGRGLSLGIWIVPWIQPELARYRFRQETLVCPRLQAKISTDRSLIVTNSKPSRSIYSQMVGDRSNNGIGRPSLPSVAEFEQDFERAFGRQMTPDERHFFRLASIVFDEDKNDISTLSSATAS